MTEQPTNSADTPRPSKELIKGVLRWLEQDKPHPKDRVLRIDSLGDIHLLPVRMKVELLISLPLIGNPKRALELAPKFLQDHPDVFDVSTRATSLFAQHEMPNEALAAAGNCLRLFNSGADRYTFLSVTTDALRLAGAYGEAHEVASVMMGRFPLERQPMVAAINLGIASGRAAESQEYAFTLENLVDSPAHVHRLLAKQAIATGRLTAFRGHRDVLRRVAPDTADTLLVRAQAAFLDRALEPAADLLASSREAKESLAARLLHSLITGTQQEELVALDTLYRPEFSRKYLELAAEAPRLSPMQQLQRIQAICVLPRETPSKPVRELLGVGDGPLVKPA